MASFMDLLAKARKKNEASSDVNSGARFKEILGIVNKHRVVRDGLTPDQMVDFLQDLGTTFVKLGQIASTHPDVLPVEYCDALGKLRTKASPMEYVVVKSQVESELGKPIDELFAEFDERPLGSASIAQVHRAVLRDEAGTQVAVKVQRPGVVETVTNDLAIMERLVELYDLVSRGEGKISFKELVDELVRTSKEELDFHVEAGNLERFHKNNEPRDKVTSPRYFAEWSSSGVLTEDFAPWPCVEDIDSIEDVTDEDRESIAYLIANNYMQQMMEDGFFHADPHAGNVLVTEDKGIEWIDFGMMGTMTARERAVLGELIGALVKGNAYELKRVMLKVATPRGPIDHSALLEACEDMTERFVDTDLEGFDTGALMNGMMEMLRSSGFDVDPFLVNLGRGLVTLEGTIHHVSPKLNIMQVLMDYIKNSFDADALQNKMRKMAAQGLESAEAMGKLPTKAADTLDMLQKGQLKVGFDLAANREFAESMRASIVIIALALLAGAIIIGSCIYSLSDHAPLLAGVSVAGAGGLLIGIALAVYVAWKGRKYLK